MKRFLFTFFLLPCLALAAPITKPNFVFILADDLGYGDVGCLNPAGKILTPHLDRLAKAGMKFTDAHSSSAVCTPTRYGLLTGRYNWRSRMQSGVQGGMSPPLIEPGRLTVASFLKSQGYQTACVGKWHLGMEWALLPDKTPFNDTIEKGPDGWKADFKLPSRNGPTGQGFDTYFGISASLDMVPYTFLKQNQTEVVPTIDNAFPMMIGRPAKTRLGPAAADFDAEHVQPRLIAESIQFIKKQAESKQPFFLYLPLAAPHTPIVPTKAWQGKSGLNPYADFVMQMDDGVGQLMDALDAAGVSKNTLLIFTSDNGCSPQADFPQLAKLGHHPSGSFRGTKADIFEGGHRVPFLVRWPDQVPAGSTSDALICLNDFFATTAEILQQKLPDNAAEDSESFLTSLQQAKPIKQRQSLVHHSINGSFALREGSWKLSFCSDSGGWSAPRPNSKKSQELPPVQLYDLAKDLGETNNLASQHPEVVTRLTARMKEIIKQGRSTPGPAQSNTVPVKLPSLLENTP
jgi:arylsulfatase A